MLSSVEQAFVGRDEKRAPLKTPAWEARGLQERGTFIEDVRHNDFIAMSVFHVKHLHVCTWF